ncbi:hypothetical protein ACFE04_014348 [Oxalis oulophora]
MDLENHEDQETGMAAAPPGYDKTGSSGGGEGGAGASSATRRSGSGIRYRECLKNHALSIGGHALDGCGEFMAAGDEGTIDALKCAACNCHRNFHRKETAPAVGGGALPHHRPQFSPNYYLTPPPPVGYIHLTPQEALPLPEGSRGGGRSYSREEEGLSNPSSSGGGGGGSPRVGSKSKRFRTKFSQEQKDKMLEFAEKIGWRFSKLEEAAIEQFCTESGIKRNVLKVWMHNNKITLGKKP